MTPPPVADSLLAVMAASFRRGARRVAWQAFRARCHELGIHPNTRRGRLLMRELNTLTREAVWLETMQAAPPTASTRWPEGRTSLETAVRVRRRPISSPTAWCKVCRKPWGRPAFNRHPTAAQRKYHMWQVVKITAWRKRVREWTPEQWAEWARRGREGCERARARRRAEQVHPHVLRVLGAPAVSDRVKARG